jgi:hypothetical protein
MSAQTFLKRPSLQTLASICSDYTNWAKHLDKGRNSITDQMPWISFSAIRFITRFVKPEMVVFEYGSGGSTIFWAKHCSKVFSVEHDLDWYQKMKNEISRLGISNVEYILAPAGNGDVSEPNDPGNPDAYASSDPEFQHKNFESYAKTIDKYPDQSFDIIIVDGRARPSCIKHALPKLKSKGFLIVDNSEREYYLKPFTFPVSQWEIRKFAGPVPYVLNFSETTILKKLN